MGEGWWQASDGKWYPPQPANDPPPPPPPPVLPAEPVSAPDPEPTTVTPPGPSETLIRPTNSGPRLGDETAMFTVPAAAEVGVPPETTTPDTPESDTPESEIPVSDTPESNTPESNSPESNSPEPPADPADPIEDVRLRMGPSDSPDRYELVEHRSTGADGELWSANLLIDDVAIPVAIKVNSPESEEDLDDARQRWLRQAEILRSLEHPALVKVREVFESTAAHAPGEPGEGSTICLVMNWVDGKPLNTWCKANPNRTLADCVRLLGPVATALDYLHTGIGGRPVLHRDLKPGNILVSNDGQVRLVGFGTARLMKMDSAMTIVGTPAWMPPEVLNGEPYDSAADRWGLGAVAFYLFTSTPPPLLNIDRAREELAATSLVGGKPLVIDHLLALLDGDPTTRPSSCTTWLRGLDDLIVAPPTPSMSPPAPPALDPNGSAPSPLAPPMAPPPPPVVPPPPPSPSPSGAADQGWQVPPPAGAPPPAPPPAPPAPPMAPPAPPMPPPAGAPPIPQPISPPPLLGGPPIPGGPISPDPKKKSKAPVIIVCGLVAIALLVVIALLSGVGR